MQYQKKSRDPWIIIGYLGMFGSFMLILWGVGVI
jgi:hypothetical protein